MMWIDVKDKDVVLPSMSKAILVTDGQRPQLITVEKFLETVDTPYNTWTHWMRIPKTEEELISEEELDELAWNSAKEEEYLDDYRNPYSKGYKAGFKKAIETLKKEI